MDLIQAAILTSTLLCSLVAGFVLAFAAVVMPGIGNLNDCDALKAFKTGSRRNYGMDSQCKIGNNTNSSKRLQRAMPLNRDVRV